MNFLAVGAHPDDVELGCLASLLERRARGHNAYAIALTLGAFSGHSRKKIEASWRVARDLLRGGRKGGNGDYLLGSFENGSLQHNWETVSFLDDVVKKYEIDVVVTHHYGEAHQDHLAAQRIAVSASRRSVDSLWLWETSIYAHRNVFPFRPQLYVPVSRPSFQSKMRALDSYRKAGILERGEIEAHRSLARYRGAEVRREYAEAFEVVWSVRDD